MLGYVQAKYPKHFMLKFPLRGQACGRSSNLD